MNTSDRVVRVRPVDHSLNFRVDLGQTELQLSNSEAYALWRGLEAHFTVASRNI